MNQFPLTSQQKVPFLCFDCRISIKIPLPFYYDEIGEKSWAQGANTHCPRCKRAMAFLGRYFKVPPKLALAQWRKAELLWQSGWLADGYSAAPRTLRDARDFVQMPNATMARRALKRRTEKEERWRQIRATRRSPRPHKDT